jgi:hypothetical protein
MSYLLSQDPFSVQCCCFLLLPFSVVIPWTLLLSLNLWTIYSVFSPPATLLVTPHFSSLGPFSGHPSPFPAFDGHPLSI